MLNYIVYLWVSNERDLWSEIHENINSGYLCLGVMNNFFKCPVFRLFLCVDVLVCFYYGQQEALVWFGLVWFLRQRKSSSFTGNQSTNCSSVSPKTRHASADTKAF